MRSRPKSLSASSSLMQRLPASSASTCRTGGRIRSSFNMIGRRGAEVASRFRPVASEENPASRNSLWETGLAVGGGGLGFIWQRRRALVAEWSSS